MQPLVSSRFKSVFSTKAVLADLPPSIKTTLDLVDLVHSLMPTSISSRSITQSGPVLLLSTLNRSLSSMTRASDNALPGLADGAWVGTGGSSRSLPGLGVGSILGLDRGDKSPLAEDDLGRSLFSPDIILRDSDDPEVTSLRRLAALA